MAPDQIDTPGNTNVMEVDNPQNNIVNARLELRLQQMVDTKFEQLKESIKNTIIEALDQHQSGQKKRPQPKQQAEISNQKRQKVVIKRKKVIKKDEEMMERRSWDQMDHGILVSIMKRLTWHELGNTVCYVNKSWFSALLDSLFPPSTSVLDLTPIDSMQHMTDQKRFLQYMRLALRRRPNTQYTRLLLPTTLIKIRAYFIILERLPSLKSLILPTKILDEVYFTCVRAVVPYLSKLEEVQCVCSLVGQFATHCKFIHTLSLYGFTEREDMFSKGWHGYIGDVLATVIADNFPGLQRLTLDSCSLSVNALSIILDAHKNTLIYLNTMHCLCREEKAFMKSYVEEKANEWDEELVLQKAPNLQVHLQCARNNCLTCSPKYFGSTNKVDSMTL